MSLCPFLSLFSSPFISNTHTHTHTHTHTQTFKCTHYACHAGFTSVSHFLCGLPKFYQYRSGIHSKKNEKKKTNIGTNIGSCPTVLSLSHAGHAEQITQYEFSAPSSEPLTPALPTLPLSHTHNPVSHTHTEWASHPHTPITITLHFPDKTYHIRQY